MGRFFGIIAAVLLIISGIVYWNYFRVFSESNRDGVLQKFGRKGDIFKTYEGELVQSSVRNMSSKVFYFSVKDQKIADSLMKLVGKEMRLHYVQYPSALPWRGENYDELNTSQNAESDKGQSIVDRIEEVRINMFDGAYYPQQYPQQAPPQATAPTQAQAPQQVAAPQTSVQQSTPAQGANSIPAQTTTTVSTEASSSTSTTTPPSN